MINVHSEVKGHVLFISDTEPLIAMVNDYFKAHQLTYDQFSNVDEGVDSFKQNQKKYDLIIVDASQHHLSQGSSLPSKIQEVSRTKRQIPILAVSEVGHENTRETLLNEGFNDVMYLPFHIQDFAARANIFIVNKQLLDKIDAQQEKLNSITLTDSITGLYNTHHFTEQASKLLPLANRQRVPLSLIIGEINDFQKINATYGFQAGDTTLQCLGILVKSTSRQEDVAARFNTSQFAILLPYCDEEGAKLKAERLEDAITKLNPDNIQVSASFGVVTTNKEVATDWGNLVDLTLKALNTAKNDAKNAITIAKA
ncbi:MAG: diguanylate cyclase [Ghiorsea sp.]